MNAELQQDISEVKEKIKKVERDIEDVKKKLKENEDTLNETLAQLHEATDEMKRKRLEKKEERLEKKEERLEKKEERLREELHDLNEKENLYLRKGEPHADVVLLYLICWFVATGPAVPIPLPIDNSFSRFWKALVDGKAEWNANTKSWHLPEKVSWLGCRGDVRNLYNRECYNNLCNIIENRPQDRKRFVLVVGTPGIGKTMFLGRILMDIVTKSRKERESGNFYEPSINYYTGKKRTERYRLLWNGTVVPADMNSVDIELSDSVDIENPLGMFLSLEVASDKEDSYNEFDKGIVELSGSLLTWMPVCQFEELLAMNPEVPPDEMNILYDTFGGSARNICLTTTDLREVDIFPCVEDTMLWFFGEEIKTKYSTLWKRIASRVSFLLSKSHSEASATRVLNSTMSHRKGGTRFWASKFMEALSGAICEQEESSIRKVIKDILGSSCFGCVFEYSSHKALTSSTRSFKLNSLHPKGTKRALKHSIYIKIPNTVTRIRNVEDINGLNAQEYGLPVSLNFPLIDAVVQPATLLQMTVSPENHSSRSIDKLPSIRAQLHDEVLEHHRMVFVVPESNLASFKYQTQLDGIAQYVMCPDPVVEISSKKNTKRPSQTIQKKSKKTKR